MSPPALVRVEPEAIGFSSARLRRIGEALRREVASGQIPGAVVGIMRAGKLAHLEAVGYRAAANASRAPKQPPTIQDLLRHTSGLTYRERGTTAAHALYPGSSLWAAERMDKDAVIAALARAPLLFDPGSSWEYGFSTDVLGFVVEAVAGTS